MGQFDSDSCDEPLVERIAEEILERKRRGEQPSLEDYYKQYPEQEEDLRSFLPALLAVESLKPDSEDKSGSIGGEVQVGGERREIIGDYRILREIGRGGMGVVFEAEQQALGRHVALKVVSRQATGSRKAVERFQREAKAAARMHHTNIVPVFDVGNDGDHLYYAMQLIQGQSLDLVIDDLKLIREQSVHDKDASDAVHDRKGKADSQVHRIAHSLVSGHFHQEQLNASGQFSPPDDEDEFQIEPTQIMGYHPDSTGSAVLPGQSDISTAEQNRDAYYHSVASIGLQTASALAYAHARGIIHRDIKPSNLLLDGAGIVWITDFGLAKTGDQDLTHTGDILGTLRYMSPERFKGQCDVRADVYSLGLTLYELLTLSPAFESADRLKLIEMIADSEPPSLRAIDPRIPRDLETIILKAIDKDPRRRYQSADDMEEDLQRYLEDEPILARRATTVERFARWSRRNPWLATAMSITVMALIAVATISTVSAQMQSELNGEIVQKNNALEETIDEKQDLIEKVTAVNHTNEELIRDLKQRESDLKRITANLAETKADYVEEKGGIAEAMHWILRSFELSEGENQGLLAKLSLTAQKMPRLRREVYVPEPSRLPEPTERLYAHLERMREQRSRATEPQFGRPSLPHELQKLLLVSNSRGRRRANPIIPNDRDILALNTDEQWVETDIQTAMRFWDLANQRWTGSVLKDLSNVTAQAIAPDNQLLAIMMLKAAEPLETEQFAETNETRGSLFSTPFIVRLEVRSLESGELLYETETEYPDRGISRLVAPRFINNGTRLLTITPVDDRFSSGYIVESIDCQIWETDRWEIELTGTAFGQNSAIVSPRLHISVDGRRLIFFSSPPPARAAAPRGLSRRGFIACFDLETGEQIGRQIPIERSAPLIASDDASQVAVVTGIGGQRSIEIRDFETGEQVGESIELSAPFQSAVQLLNISADRSKIVVAYTSGLQRSGRQRLFAEQVDEEAPALRSSVQVFDLASGRTVSPPLTAHGRVTSAYFSNQDQTLTVRDELGLRVWELTGSALQHVLIPNLTLQQTRTVRGGGRPNPPNGFGSRGDRNRLITTAAKQHVMMIQTENHEVRLTDWDGRTGQLSRESSFLDDKTARAPGASVLISPGGSFLLIGVRKRNDKSRESQCWRTDPVELLEGSIELEGDASLKAISPDGEWIAIAKTEQVSGSEQTDNSLSPGQRFRRGRRRQGAGFRRPALVDPDEASENEPPSQDAVVVKLVHRVTEQRRDVPTIRIYNDIRSIDISFSANGQFLSVGNGGFIQVFDLTSQPIRRLDRLSVTSGQTGRFGGRGGGFRGQIEQNVWAVNHEATLIADVIDRTALRIRQMGTRQTLGELLVHPAPITAVCFDVEGKTVVTACEDGLVRQWSLPETWSGTPEEIRRRVERHTGMELVDAETSKVKQLTGGEEIGEQWSNRSAVAQQSLSRFEQDTLFLRNRQDWEATAIALEKWQALRPDDWLPTLLRIRPLVEQQKIAEAEGLVQQVARQIDRNTFTAWIRAEFVETDSGRQGASPRYNNITENNAAALGWRHHLLLGISRNDSERANHLLELAKVREVELRFEEAVEYINQAVEKNGNSADMHYYRAHLMARLGQWDEETGSRRKVAMLDPEERWSLFRHVAAVLDNGTRDDFWEAWHASVEARKPIIEDPASTDAVIFFNRDFIAKPRLIASAEPGHLLDLALEYADQNYGHPYAKGKDLEHWAKVLKGIAEYRRDHWQQSIEILEDAFQGLGAFMDGSDERGQAICRFFAAMAYQQLGEHDQARVMYFEGLDHHHRDRAVNLASTGANWTDWHLAEVARRETEQQLGIDKDQIGRQSLDLSGWKVIYEDDFEQETFRNDWHVYNGDWSIEGGAARGVYTGRDYRGFKEAAIDLNLDVPETVQIEFESWWPEESLCELKLMPAVNANEGQAFRDRTLSYTVGLSGYQHYARQRFTWSGNGAHLIDFSEVGGNWFDSPVKKEFLPEKKYKVRVLQQPNRITVYVDDGNGEIELFNQRISGPSGKIVRLYGLGTPGQSIYFDNLKIRAPESE